MFSLLELTTKLALFVTIFFASRFLWNYLRSPLKSFPGPKLASFTNLWRMQDVAKGRCDITHNKLHRIHGPAVRMGPNVLSLSDPNLISLVYNTKNPWLKSHLYKVADVVIGGVRLSNLFSSRNESWHSTYIRPVKSSYSMSKVQDLESNLDITIELLIDQLRERFVCTGKTCEMSDWINFFAWDAMSQVNFSQDLGILEAGSDYKGFLRRSNQSIDYFASIGQIPLLDHIFGKNPIMAIGPPTFLWANAFSLDQLHKRHKEGNHDGPDLLAKFLDAKKKNPELVDDNTIVMWLVANVLAGSDTTASTMCATTYYVLKNSAVYKRLCDELRAANLSFPAKWKEIQGLKYLEAVMRESMRINPGIGLMIERIVPKGGFTLPDGRFVAEGTTVGMNPWVINRNEAVFGAKTEEFIPERWLQRPEEPEESFQARFSKMKSTDFTFGAGSRACLGRYLSELESFKLIATLFNTFDINLPSQDHEWQIRNSWFVRQDNIPVRLVERA
ncbi:hypothetical protein N7517_010464 [Penicillium concentricum]|uniref:Cytochrome P450 n=1 Tax=Penicillium concentricum TaxID=293559 RepID=A0A9W9UUF6_9EURO|nr:uncharacterized protein N7517_010464 [Penicillium concentricum]KAJ5355855.1 hypothetical protein N7517_010464 [Penicillium concentricum]